MKAFSQASTETAGKAISMHYSSGISMFQQKFQGDTAISRLFV